MMQSERSIAFVIQEVGQTPVRRSPVSRRREPNRSFKRFDRLIMPSLTHENQA